jgi:hypothetical protein
MPQAVAPHKRGEGKRAASTPTASGRRSRLLDLISTSKGILSGRRRPARVNLVEQRLLTDALISSAGNPKSLSGPSKADACSSGPQVNSTTIHPAPGAARPRHQEVIPGWILSFLKNGFRRN